MKIMTKIEETNGNATEIAELKKQLAAAEDKMLWAGLPTSPEFDALVAQKIRAGLDRESAILCARRQTLHDAVVKDHEAVVAAAVAKVEKEFQGKDRRSQEYKDALAQAKSEAAAVNNTTARLIAAGSHQLHGA
jgi:hypothetical protein